MLFKMESKTFRYRIYPNQTQIDCFNNIIKNCEVLYNLLVYEDKRIYRHYKKWKLINQKPDKNGEHKWHSNVEFINASSGYTLFKELKNTTKYEYFKNVPSDIIRQVVNDYCGAKTKHFANPKHFGRPRYKKSNSVKSFTIPHGATKIVDNKITIPGCNGLAIKIKPSQVEFIKHRKPRGSCEYVTKNGDKKFHKYTIVREGDKWFVNILYQWEANNVPIHQHSKTEIGIDLGVAISIALSNDEKFKLDELSIKKLNDSKKKYQKFAARKEARDKRTNSQGSNKWKKVIKKIANIDAEIKRIRNDFLEKISQDIASKYETIYLEDLKIVNMTKSASGTKENPGKNVAQKKGLNRSILNQAWGLFITKLEEKARRYGGTVIKVDPKHTSQRCNKCHFIHKNNRKSQSEFECISCGHKDNADTNSAKNMVDRGKGLW